jgi:hypothetical protein
VAGFVVIEAGDAVLAPPHPRMETNAEKAKCHMDRLAKEVIDSQPVPIE